MTCVFCMGNCDSAACANVFGTCSITAEKDKRYKTHQDTRRKTPKLCAEAACTDFGAAAGAM